jgi:large subunit ribosomal protein L9
MKIFLLKSVPKVGLKGEIIHVSEGYARNFLIPQKYGIEVTPHNESSLKHKIKVVENRKEALQNELTLKAENMKDVSITLSKKIHDGGKLYGAVTSTEVSDLLKDQGYDIDKSQINFGQSVKSVGDYKVSIKLSPSIKTNITLHVVGQ